MTVTHLPTPAHYTATAPRAVGRWCLIALAVMTLSSCRGLEQAPTDKVAQRNPLRTTSDHPDALIATQAADPPQVARLPALPAGKTLSDQPAGADPPALPAAQIVPVGHTTPATAPQAPANPPNGAASSPQPATLPLGQVYPCVPVPPPCGYGPGMMPYGPDPGCPNGVPCGAWTPPGIACPWPTDEYLCDGGDEIPGVQVRSDWTVAGLQLEDTVVHYDTVAGRTEVQPSNRVCVYAPRFAAVRKVYGVVQHDAHEQVSGIDYPMPVDGLGDVQRATTAVQPLPPGVKRGTSALSAFRERTPSTGLENSQALVGTHGGLLPYEDFTLIQRGQMDNSEKARLAERVAAAVAWSHDTALQVIIDDLALQEDLNVTQAESVHIYSLEGKPRLQVCKIASRHEARPGETVEFTIRFDNLGDQVIGNVTVIDNLTTRLEYVEGSQTCSLGANFSASTNEGESLTLRWEIIEPMKVGQGGVIRFQCRVR